MKQEDEILNRKLALYISTPGFDRVPWWEQDSRTTEVEGRFWSSIAE